MSQVQSNKQVKVIIYSTPYCQFCKQVKAYFDEKGIEWREVDVMEDSSAAEEMIKKSGQMGVPVIDYHGQIIVGFNKLALDRATAV